jgi:cellulose synthase (UDP-forming)
VPHGRSVRGRVVSTSRRAQVLGILAVVVNLAYVLWRLTTTVPSPAGVGLLVLEAYGTLGLALFVFSVWDRRPVRPMGPAAGAPPLRVAVLVCTFDEEENVLLPTVAGAVALTPVHETWVLDDGDRPWVREMAAALGARYVTRPNRHHAKAGNLNHALALVNAELVAVLDADHVPSAGFLERTLPYFADPTVALVQTPQDFTNRTSFEHVGDEHDESLFYRAIQPGKNRWRAAFWCGTSAVLRVDALRSVGGVATSSVTEDYLTTIRLCGAGWRTVYHDEVLCRGLAPGTYREYLVQRRRWAAGAMQVLRSRDNPLVAPGLSPTQRVAFTASALGWFDGVRTLGLVAVAVMVATTGSPPVDADPMVFAVAACTAIALGQAAMATLTDGRFRILPAVVFDALRIPVGLAALRRLVLPGDLAFAVTRKGRTGVERSAGRVPRSLVVATAAAVSAWMVVLLRNLGLLPGPTGPHVTLAAVVLLVQAGVLLTAIERIRHPSFADDRRRAQRFDRGLPVRVGNSWLQFVCTSTTGGRLVHPIPRDLYELHLLTDEGVVRIVGRSTGTAGGSVSIDFESGQWPQRAALARTLYRTALRADEGDGGHGYGSERGRVLETFA